MVENTKAPFNNEQQTNKKLYFHEIKCILDNSLFLVAGYKSCPELKGNIFTDYMEPIDGMI